MSPAPVKKGTAVTARQQQVLDFIKDYWCTRRMAPTFQEIAEHLNGIGKSAVHDHLHALKRRGLLDWKPRAFRTVHLLDAQGVPLTQFSGESSQ